MHEWNCHLEIVSHPQATEIASISEKIFHRKRSLGAPGGSLGNNTYSRKLVYDSANKQLR